MFLLAEYCKNSGILQTIYILKTLGNIVCILVPIFIILSGMKSLFKVVTDDEKLNDSVKSFITKIIIGAFIFFIPGIVTTVIKYASNDNYSCLSEATLEKIDYYKNLEQKEVNKKLTEKNTKKAENEKNTKKQDEKNKKQAEQTARENEREREKEREQNQSQNVVTPGNNNIPQNANTNYEGTLYVGDSRTVGMYFALYGGSYSSSVNTSYGSEKWLAKVSMGYNWFKSTGIPYIQSYVSKGNYEVTIQMGANDLYNSSLASSYVSLINELVASYPNSKFIVISVNPIDDNKAKSYGYTATNNQVINFNNSYRNSISGKNITYCDTYSSVIGNYTATDGIHYNNATYKNVYNAIRSCL